MAVLATKTQRLTSLALWLILLLATFFRFYHLAGQSLWSDEGNSVALARRSLAEIARRTAFDIHPPFYYWLLKIWTGLFGDSEAGLRSLAAVLGVACVYLTWHIAVRLLGRRVALIATLIAALSPFQIYYAQEARMYMLLALLGTLTILLAVLLVDQFDSLWLKVGYIATVTAGLYTHYAYPIVWVAAVIAVSYQLLAVSRQPSAVSTHHSSFIIHHSSLPSWLFLQLIPLLLYLPWLPTAWRQVTTWPSEPQPATLTDILQTIGDTLLFGLSWPYDTGWLSVIGLAFLLGLAVAGLWYKTPGVTTITSLSKSQPKPSHVLRPTFVSLLLLLWFSGPVILTGFIFNPAFLKFLLVAAPALAILLAIGLIHLARLARPRWVGLGLSGACLAGLVTTSLLSLYYYYTSDDAARDNYRGIVQFIKSVGEAGDAIILNAEGQQDVFGYYYEQQPTLEAPVYPLPQGRPLDKAATLAELETIAADSEKIFAVYWATQQADPDGLIENWLDTHLFKATDQWYGNVRLVSYAAPQINPLYQVVNYHWNNGIQLVGVALSTTKITPGDILQVSLQWETEAPLTENYTVFLQVLDANNHLVGQRDAPPLVPTTQWPVNESVSDSHGIFIEPGTPPGAHRLIIGLYHSETGQRLPVVGQDETQDFIVLDEVEVTRPAVPLPAGAFHIQQPIDVAQQGLRLLGYDFYKLGQRSNPASPLHPGDPIQLVAYWTLDGAKTRLENEVEIELIDSQGQATGVSVTKPLAGVDLPLAQWQPGEVIRAQYDLLLNVEPGVYRLRLTVRGPDDAEPFEINTKVFQIG
ncbi:MAG: glycosyltransferase family 39 protein [Anaerolineae bacterium]|nr:glycosyltransferase family 39 protein [Anaerolineae bacterium]MCB9104659.1 glycosyltransferase family 39 protein [Anaerolineales bacterium]